MNRISTVILILFCTVSQAQASDFVEPKPADSDGVYDPFVDPIYDHLYLYPESDFVLNEENKGGCGFICFLFEAVSSLAWAYSMQAPAATPTPTSVAVDLTMRNSSKMEKVITLATVDMITARFKGDSND